MNIELLNKLQDKKNKIEMGVLHDVIEFSYGCTIDGWEYIDKKVSKQLESNEEWLLLRDIIKEIVNNEDAEGIRYYG